MSVWVHTLFSMYIYAHVDVEESGESSLQGDVRSSQATPQIAGRWLCSQALSGPASLSLSLSRSRSLSPSSEFLTTPTPPLTLPRSWQLGPNSALTTLPELTTVIILHWTHWSLKVIPTSLLVEVNRCVWCEITSQRLRGVRQIPKFNPFLGTARKDCCQRGFFPLFPFIFNSHFLTCVSDLMTRDSHKCLEHFCVSEGINASTVHSWRR